jgi:hypothetical protein
MKYRALGRHPLTLKLKDMNGLLLFKAVVLLLAIVTMGAWYDIKRKDGSRSPTLLVISADLWAFFYYITNQ